MSLSNRGSVSARPRSIRSGSSPAQTRKSISPGASIGGPFRTFADAVSIDMRITSVACNSRSERGTDVVPATRARVFGDGTECLQFFAGIRNGDRSAEHDDGAKIHGVCESGAREDDTVRDRHANAHIALARPL
jgi:hypothetical protein